MAIRSAWSAALAVLLALGSAGCDEGRSDASPNPEGVIAEPVTLADAEACPVTLPRPTGPAGVSPEDFFGWGASFGNGELWVGGLWPGGLIDAGSRFVQEDGSVGMKFGWWRATPGELRVSGRRLDASAPPLRADVPDGYGDDGFQATGVSFPTEGCWEVTGSVGATTLTFVTFVNTRAGGG